jgi:hypothetical protein
VTYAADVVLADADPMGFVLVTDLDASRAFDVDRLGLKVNA